MLPCTCWRKGWIVCEFDASIKFIFTAKLGNSAQIFIILYYIYYITTLLNYHMIISIMTPAFCNTICTWPRMLKKHNSYFSGLKNEFSIYIKSNKVNNSKKKRERKGNVRYSTFCRWKKWCSRSDQIVRSRYDERNRPHMLICQVSETGLLVLKYTSDVFKLELDGLHLNLQVA